MTGLAVYALSYAAFVCLSLAVDRHHRAVFGTAATPRRRVPLRIGGYTALAVSLVMAIQSRGAGIGATVWTGAISVAALLLVVVLPYWPRSTLYSGAGALLVSIAVLLSHLTP